MNGRNLALKATVLIALQQLVVGVGEAVVQVDALHPAVEATAHNFSVGFAHDEAGLLAKLGLASTFRVATMSAPVPVNASHDVVMEAAAAAVAGSQSLIVVVPGTAPPPRRASLDQPFLVVDTDAQGQELRSLSEQYASLIAVPAVNTAVRVLEAASGVQLYPLRLRLVELGPSLTGSGVVAMYDASDGLVLLDSRVARGPLEWAQTLGDASAHFADALFSKVAGSQVQASSLSSMAQAVAAAGGAAAMGTILGRPPLWFCLACPVVLATLAPLLLNAGLTQVAEALCNHYHLPTDQCNQLWYGAFALAMVLSFASAIPIVFICRLPECAKKPSTMPLT